MVAVLPLSWWFLFRHSVFPTPWTARQASLSFTISWSLLKLMSTESVMPSNHLILCFPPSPPAFSLSQRQGLFNELALHIKWPKYWSFSFSIRSSNECSGLISFKIDWFDYYGNLFLYQGIHKEYRLTLCMCVCVENIRTCIPF